MRSGRDGSHPSQETRSEQKSGHRTTDREILRLAVPAFLALVAEPLFLLADAAFIGHLGTPELAGLGIAGAVLQTAVGLCVFLAYGTTASVARHVGAGDLRGALTQGIDGVWLAVLIGAITTVVGIVATPWLVGAFGAGGEVAGHATTYLRIAFLGTTPLLVMLATTGVLRGLQDTRTPLVAAVVGNLLNIVFNGLLVYGVGPLPALGLRGVGARLGAGPGARRGVPAGDRLPRRPRRGRVAAPRPARHPRGRPRRGGPGDPDPHPARRAAGDDVRRHAHRAGTPTSPPTSWR